MKIKSYMENEHWLKREHFQNIFSHAKRIFITGKSKARFVYCPLRKIIYECVDINSYRHITHSEILEHFKLDQNKAWRLEFNQEKDYEDNYIYNEFGINGLAYSDLYYSSKKLMDILPVLSKQDLDNIENYIKSLKSELKD